MFFFIFHKESIYAFQNVVYLVHFAFVVDYFYLSLTREPNARDN